MDGGRGPGRCPGQRKAAIGQDGFPEQAARPPLFALAKVVLYRSIPLLSSRRFVMAPGGNPPVSAVQPVSLCRLRRALAVPRFSEAILLNHLGEGLPGAKNVVMQFG